jgi:hypothetical protein
MFIEKQPTNQKRYICSMIQYIVRMSIATGYRYGEGWNYNGETSVMLFSEPIQANKAYDGLMNELSTKAAIYGHAVKLELIRSVAGEQEVQRHNEYDGENVRMWFAAYHKPGNAIEERRYIDRIYYDIGYYTFMVQKEENPPVIPVAIAKTLEELQTLLGETFDMYEY